MITFIALFRGINVGGNNILPMKDLVSILENLGCQKVKTYIQSGNVIFQIEENKAKNIDSKINSEILKLQGFDTKVLLLETSKFLNIIRNNPFKTAEGNRAHIFFLYSIPVNPDLEKLNNLKSTSENFVLNGIAFYLHAPEGIGRSKLAANVERCLGISVTARNLNTINKLISMLKQ
ncbi:MAG: hypothetical protein CO128_08575 [Ignavibacteriales bacterium CG_4_9_14_3_um_filter_30_11]|nr:MAG: hypothetical protein CO128_08575 [Ignavibacteriales bacterium CG_4_9_14_3_um_filter_30_11]